MLEERLQKQRFELKYIVPEHIALEVRRFVRCYLQVDDFGAKFPNLSYPVHSLYLDSPTLHTYHATINGNKNRYKLRLRFYNNDPESPIYFEIKRRMDNCILKERGGVFRKYVPYLLAGHLPEKQHLIRQDPVQYKALQNFCYLLSQLQARPMAHVAYQREAWLLPDNNAVRVTMDRQVLIESQPSANFEVNMRNPVLVFGNSVILELKFTDRFPNWFGELVRVFGLAQGSAAKYADGVHLIGENAVKSAFSLDRAPQVSSPIPLPGMGDELKQKQPAIAS